ncbi:MAG: tRNA1(Val) (adenine(37)-N6)-methyltransferase [Alphaproteobacteria bacterium]
MIGSEFVRPIAKTIDAFLDGRVEAVQPESGYHRSGLEAVLLGAAIGDDVSGTIVDLGAGAGVAGFCAAARCPKADVVLVERNSAMVECSREALRRPANSGFSDRVSVASVDIVSSESVRAAGGFRREMARIVITNPPFHRADAVRSSPTGPRADAHVLSTDLDMWLRAAAFTLASGGVVIVVMIASALPELLAAIGSRFGAATILPLYPRPAAPASRLLMRATKGSKAQVELLPGLVLHPAEGSAFTDPLNQILREGASIADVHSPWSRRAED